MRMALRDDVRDPGTSRKWDARIAELQDKLLRSEDDCGELLAGVERAKREAAKGSDNTEGLRSCWQRVCCRPSRSCDCYPGHGAMSSSRRNVFEHAARR
jgi:hypothetical protein